MNFGTFFIFTLNVLFINMSVIMIYLYKNLHLDMYLYYFFILLFILLLYYLLLFFKKPDLVLKNRIFFKKRQKSRGIYKKAGLYFLVVECIILYFLCKDINI